MNPYNVPSGTMTVDMSFVAVVAVVGGEDLERLLWQLVAWCRCLPVPRCVVAAAVAAVDKWWTMRQRPTGALVARPWFAAAAVAAVATVVSRGSNDRHDK